MPDPVRVTYFTDPLCPWCWAFEPQWRRLRFEFGAGLRWQYRMGGLLSGWGRYHDPVNEIHNPGQMATQWLQVAELTDVPIDASIWRAAPPASSYPACLAFKAAESFGPPFAEAYLRRLREAVMLEGRDVSRREVLLDVAAAAGADPIAFEAAFDGPEAAGAFRDDLTETRYREIQRFPTLVLHRSGPMGLALVGCRPYEALREALAKVAPDLAPDPIDGPNDLAEYVEHWGRVTGQEIAANLGIEPDRAREEVARIGMTAFLLHSSIGTSS